MPIDFFNLTRGLLYCTHRFYFYSHKMRTTHLSLGSDRRSYQYDPDLNGRSKEACICSISFFFWKLPCKLVKVYLKLFTLYYKKISTKMFGYYLLGSQSFTSLMADLCQDISKQSIFINRYLQMPYGTFA